ncbi:hypothetical protein [Aquabacterium sp.]|uniref:hypothetical protein n=1 Tax=Aquabacterium sp. TaxID=1872578 RepID=UPI0037839F21
MTLIRSFSVVAVLAAASGLCAAQGASAPASSAKKELAQKVVQLQQPAIEQAARQLAEQSVAPLVQQAGTVVQTRVPPEQREALARELQGDLKKFGDETVGMLRERALKLAPTTIGPVLEERLSEDELKQVVAMLEAPIYRKYQSLGGDMQRALLEKLVADTRTSVEPKLRALQESMGKHINAAMAAAAASGAGSGSKPAAAAKPAASTPKK